MIDLVLVTKNILCYLQDVKAVRGMGQGLTYHCVVLCKVKLVGACIKRKEVMTGTRRIRSEKLRKWQYIEGYARCLESKKIEWDEHRNIE